VTGSVIFAHASRTWRALRAEFETVRESAFREASNACNGVLLNVRGKKQGVDPYTLFIGNEVRAHAYASEELVEWWRKHPRLTWTAFERQSIEVPFEESA
jgi:hypothetical protein